MYLLKQFNKQLKQNKMTQLIKTIIALLLIGAIYYKADTLGPSIALSCLLLSNLFTNKTK